MASFAIGEVEELLGLPASTLRHWEKVLPLLSPRKDDFGRRVYNEADIRLLLRLKHLTLRRGLGLAAAAEAVFAEIGEAQGRADSPGAGGSARAAELRGAELRAAELRGRLAEIRGELIGLWAESRLLSRKLEHRPQQGAPR
jgi:DNA-binding transcriptional MerR regulator